MHDPSPQKPHALCGAKTRSGKPCKHEAGKRTDHPGQGKCWLHGGATPIRHGRYSTVKRPRIRELLDQFENDPAPLDMLPEVTLLRALILDFIERWDEYADLTARWHALYSTAYAEALSDWREKVTDMLDDGGWRDVEVTDLPPVPDPLDYEIGKPRQTLDITAAAGLVDKVGAMIDRIEKQKREGAITLETLDRVLEQLGMEVVHALSEEVSDGPTRTKVLAAIERRWNGVRVDPTSARQGITGSSRPIN